MMLKKIRLWSILYSKASLLFKTSTKYYFTPM